MKGQLVLKNVIIRLKMGKEAFEKVSSRDIPVDVVWTGEIEGNLSIDYTEICSVLARFEETDYNYIEELASDIITVLQEEFPVGYWKVTVNKPFPPVSLRMDFTSFTMEGGGNA